ncbi:copper resistance CopC family protein [Marinactinospora rubrisoli]|uniref:Copper resistance protein CopC n=1 Tax=Marinactinospora rubrisoli TaxID=2715399 RepID=A0ABW2KAZ9_9ACTN
MNTRKRHRLWAGLLAALFTALLLGLGTAPAAHAHNVLISSSPEDGSTPAQAPDEIRLTFNTTVGSGGNGITVTGPDGQKYEEGEVRVDAEQASIALRAPEQAGQYQVNYRIISADGHPIDGEIAYTLTPDALPSAAPSPDPEGSAPAGPSQGGAAGSSSQDPGGQSEPTNPLAATGPVAAAVVGIAIIALAVILLIRYRRPGGPGQRPEDGDGHGGPDAPNRQDG